MEGLSSYWPLDVFLQDFIQIFILLVPLILIILCAYKLRKIAESWIIGIFLFTVFGKILASIPAMLILFSVNLPLKKLSILLLISTTLNRVVEILFLIAVYKICLKIKKMSLVK